MEQKTYTPPPVTGYRTLTQAEINFMNEAKALEAVAASLVEKARLAIELETGAPPTPQQARDLAMAKTAYEDATIRLVRAIAHPVSPWFPRAPA